MNLMEEVKRLREDYVEWKRTHYDIGSDLELENQFLSENGDRVYQLFVVVHKIIFNLTKETSISRIYTPRRMMSVNIYSRTVTSEFMGFKYFQCILGHLCASNSETLE